MDHGWSPRFTLFWLICTGTMIAAQSHGDELLLESVGTSSKLGRVRQHD